MGCSHAVGLYTDRHVVARFIKGGNTVNLCAIDLSKAFDKVNHHALLMKLMKRNLPVVLINILENWLKIGKMGLCTLIHICCKIWS